MTFVTVVDAARMIADAHARGEEVVTVTIVNGEHAGKRLVLPANASVDHEVLRGIVARAWESRTTVFTADYFAELHALPEPLLIFGAGHIAVPLANIAHDLGFAVTVLDDRDDFAQPARFHPGVRVQQVDFRAPLADLDLSARSFVVLVTRAHKYDFDCLQAVLHHSVLPRYIGMIGSKRRVRAAFKALLDAGVDRELLARVRAPIGIEIGAETPAEIAVSIAAELIQARRSGRLASMADDARILERMLPGAAAQ